MATLEICTKYLIVDKTFHHYNFHSQWVLSKSKQRMKSSEELPSLSVYLLSVFKCCKLIKAVESMTLAHLFGNWLPAF